MGRQAKLFPDFEARDGVLFRDTFSAETRAINIDQRTVEHIISDESVDAHGSIIRVDGWDLKRFMKNPVVPFGHDKSSFPIGRSLNISIEGKKLLAVTQFAGMEQNHPAAETAFALVRDKFLRAWSVGFRPRKWEPRKLDEEEAGKWMDPFIYTDQELFEYSLVPVPSNANALAKARDSGIDINPLLAWIEQRQELVAFITARGLALPGINDRIEIPDPTNTGDLPLSASHPIDTRNSDEEFMSALQDFIIEETISEL